MRKTMAGQASLCGPESYESVAASWSVIVGPRPGPREVNGLGPRAELGTAVSSVLRIRRCCRA